MKATWLMALVSYAVTVLSIWWICMQRVRLFRACNCLIEAQHIFFIMAAKLFSKEMNMKENTTSCKMSKVLVLYSLL